MHLLLPPPILDRIRRELRKGGRREIGGLLMGEHVVGDTFRLVDFSVQRSAGSAVNFVRDPNQHQAQLDAFFVRTSGDFARFNYLGEWHSHPNFEPLPSPQDMETMQSIVADPDVGVNFLILLIARLSFWGCQLKLSVTLYRPMRAPESVSASVEGGSRTLHLVVSRR